MTLTLLSLVQAYVVTAFIPLLVVRTIGAMVPLLHIVWLGGVATAIGSGCTSTVAVIASPAQPSPLVGMIVKVTVWSNPVRLRSVPLISPVPLAAMPVTLTLLSLVQAYVVTAFIPLLVVRTIGAMVPLLHIVWLGGVATAIGSGCTSTVAVIASPAQPSPLVGMIVKVTVWSNPVRLRSVPLISPCSAGGYACDIDIVIPVQAYVVTAFIPLLVVRTIGAMVPLLHIVWLGGVATAIGSGCTSTVAVIASPAQPSPLVGMIVKLLSGPIPSGYGAYR